jgi:methionyl-tRNA formyltransferase
MKRYRTVFIGNRPLILYSLINNPEVELVHAFIIKDSLISENYLGGVPHTFCGDGDKDLLLSFLTSYNYELCVSAGCPYILPVGSLPKSRVFINSHPSALPLGKGIHPINECIFSTHQKAGSTLHYLSEELDGGEIIHQQAFDLSEDIDLDLLYSFIFDIEREVFDVGLMKIFLADLRFKGQSQEGLGTYYSRSFNDQVVDILNIGTAELLQKVRAFSSDALGVHFTLGDKKIIIFMAHLIMNQFVNKRFNTVPTGDVIFSNDRFILLKLRDGIVRIDKWIIV